MPRTNPQRYVDPLRATRTRAETARLVGCSVNKIDPLIEGGLLISIPVGNRDAITVASIERLLGQPIERLEAPLRSVPEPVPAEPKPPPLRTKRSTPRRRKRQRRPVQIILPAPPATP